MKKTVRRVLLCTVVVAILGFTFLHFYSFLHKNYAYSLCFDPLFSAQARAEVTPWVQEHSQSLSVAALACALPQAFSCIKAVQYHRTPAGGYTIALTSCRPRIMLNATHVLTESAVVPVHYFANASCEGIPHVVCTQDMLSLPHVYWQPLLSLAAEFFQDYALACENEITACITCKNAPGYSVVADMQSLISGVPLHTIAKLYAAYCAKKSRKKNQKVVYDIRFNNQILEYALRGSKYDSKQGVVS
jgi:hypothetical protein